MNTRIKLKLDSIYPFANGEAFGDTGSYQCVSGTASFLIDPSDSVNANITDLSLAPTDASGAVEYSTDFFILKPSDLTRGNRTLLYDVNNRGSKRILQFMNDGMHSNNPLLREHAGNGFLQRRGYSIVWSGWQGDLLPGDGRLTMDLPIPVSEGKSITGLVRSEFIVDQDGVYCLPLSGNSYTISYPTVSLDTSEAVLTCREYEHDARAVVPSSKWRFGKLDKNGNIVDSNTYCCLESGFEPGLIYELIYTGMNPRLLGLGFLGVRDLISFLKVEKTDANGLPNPLFDEMALYERSYAWGRSLSGRFLREFVYQGYNESSLGEKVFDAVSPHVSGGGRVSLNHRFAQPGRFPKKQADHLYPSDQFPFAYAILQDPYTGVKDGILKRTKTDPLVIHTQTASEYWDRRGSLVHTDLQGQDLPEHEKVRVFLFSGSQHFADPLLSGEDAILGEISGATRYTANPLNTTPLLRALLDRLDKWVREDVPPPSSRVPSIENGTAVKSGEVREKFPNIPGVSRLFEINEVYLQDHGDGFDKGMLDREPPIEHLDKKYSLYVSQIDQDGNETAGIQTPNIVAPLATYTGWNMRPFGNAENAPAGTTGSYFPFAAAENTRQRKNDPRLSIEARYSSVDDYVRAISNAAIKLCEDGLLLEEDARRYINEARGAFFSALQS